jgi:hypothetical protein
MPELGPYGSVPGARGVALPNWQRLGAWTWIIKSPPARVDVRFTAMNGLMHRSKIHAIRVVSALERAGGGWCSQRRQETASLRGLNENLRDGEREPRGVAAPRGSHPRPRSKKSDQYLAVSGPFPTPLNRKLRPTLNTLLVSLTEIGRSKVLAKQATGPQTKSFERLPKL